MAVDLGNILLGKVVIVGVGNILKGDDGVGPSLIDRIKGKVPYVCIDAATALESYAGKIIKESPKTVLLVDAVHLEREPGAYEVLTKEEIVNNGLTTHDISPKMFLDYLGSQITADIYLLGIQPKNMQIGDEMSLEIKQTLDTIERILLCTKPT